MGGLRHMAATWRRRRFLSRLRQYGLLDADCYTALERLEAQEPSDPTTTRASKIALFKRCTPTTRLSFFFTPPRFLLTSCTVTPGLPAVIGPIRSSIVRLDPERLAELGHPSPIAVEGGGGSLSQSVRSRVGASPGTLRAWTRHSPAASDVWWEWSLFLIAQAARQALCRTLNSLRRRFPFPGAAARFLPAAAEGTARLARGQMMRGDAAVSPSRLRQGRT